MLARASASHLRLTEQSVLWSVRPVFAPEQLQQDDVTEPAIALSFRVGFNTVAAFWSGFFAESPTVPVAQAVSTLHVWGEVRHSDFLQIDVQCSLRNSSEIGNMYIIM